MESDSSAQSYQAEMSTELKFHIHPSIQKQINQTIAKGFEKFFFNALDPEIAKTNIPTKLRSSKHIAIVIATALLIGTVVGSIFMIRSQAPHLFEAAIVLLIVSYISYVIISFCFSQIRAYITNLKKFNDYKATYDKMVEGRGYFRFWIECYHYQSSSDPFDDDDIQVKVVTHTATEDYFPAQCVDESGDIKGIIDLTKYVFIKYRKRFYFSDKSSQHKVNAAYSSFISRHRSDTYQEYTKTYEIQGFEEQVGFCMLGESPQNCAAFTIFTLLGLALPYSCILERSISRYSINILKKLTC